MLTYIFISIITICVLLIILQAYKMEQLAKYYKEAKLKQHIEK